ncbi:MAG TPA: glycosyltransferase family 4 protein [Acidimicrobiia bacterium]|nr:glycosyltransferase family 4 protein [Acidimicrobiia bacterium]
MKVLLVASEAPPVVSGVARSVGRLADGLAELGHDVDVVSMADVPHWYVGEWRVSAFVATWPRLLRRIHRADVVNLHGPVPTMSDAFLALWRTVPKGRRPPLVYTHHCTIELDGLKTACRAYTRVHERLAHLADRIVVTTDSYQEILADGGRTPVDVVPWGVDMPADHHRPLLPRPGPLRVLCVGQMRPYKGMDRLVRATAGIPGIEATLVGGGSLEHELRRLAAHLGGGNITFAGRVHDDALPGLYAAHDVVALPSVTKLEAFGITLLEGMSAGCVPVASDLPGVRDVAGPTGILVPPGDIAALRRALLDLASEPRRLHALRDASRRRATTFAWDEVVDGYDAALHTAAGIERTTIDLTRPHATAHLVPTRRRRRPALIGLRPRRLPTESAAAEGEQAIPGRHLSQPRDLHEPPLRRVVAGNGVEEDEVWVRPRDAEDLTDVGRPQPVEGKVGALRLAEQATPGAYPDPRP